jgi:hypothetical protein
MITDEFGWERQKGNPNQVQICSAKGYFGPRSSVHGSIPCARLMQPRRSRSWAGGGSLTRPTDRETAFCNGSAGSAHVCCRTNPDRSGGACGEPYCRHRRPHDRCRSRGVVGGPLRSSSMLAIFSVTFQIECIPPKPAARVSTRKGISSNSCLRVVVGGWGRSYPAKLHPKHVCQMCANSARVGQIHLRITEASAFTIY